MNDASARGDVTRLLARVRSIDERREATERVFVAAYEELRRLAGELLRRERPDHTLRPTALVHEAYLRLVDQRCVDLDDRARFRGIAARAMRRILVDHARRRAAAKRGAAGTRITIEDDHAVDAPVAVEILDLHDAIERLAALDRRTARVVELRVFGGLTINEVATALAVSSRTAAEEWRFARMWLGRELDQATPEPDS